MSKYIIFNKVNNLTTIYKHPNSVAVFFWGRNFDEYILIVSDDTDRIFDLKNSSTDITILEKNLMEF